jgi:hypothetical protein
MCTAIRRESKTRASSRENTNAKSRSLHIEARRQPSGTVSFVTGSSPRNQTVGLVPVLMNHEETSARGGSGAEAATRRRRPRGRQTESAFMWKAKRERKKSASANAPLVFVFSRSPRAGPPRTTRDAPRRVRSAPSSAETRAKTPRTPRTSRLQLRLRKRPPRPRGFRRRARTRRRRATRTPRWRSLGGGWMPRTRRASGRRHRRDGGATRGPRRRFARDTSSARWTRLATRGRETSPRRAARARAPMRRRRARGCSFRGFRRAVATRPAPRSTPGDASWWACWNATDDRTSAARPLVAIRASGSAESDVKPSTSANAAGQSSRSRLTDPRWTRQRLPRNSKELHLLGGHAYHTARRLASTRPLGARASRCDVGSGFRVALGDARRVGDRATSHGNGLRRQNLKL